jgi:fructose-bisphosphate aldolase class II
MSPNPSLIALSTSSIMCSVPPLMNIDTDLQFAYTEGTRDYITGKIDYLKTQIGNPEGEDIPNKKYYDPRKWLRESELTFIKRLEQAFADLNNVNTLSK